MNKITSINGTLLASLNELKEHTENGTVHVTENERTAWNTQATVKAKGILIAAQEDLEEHAGNKALHVTEEERATWNAKADASALSGKISTTTFNSHTDDAVKHVTAEERAAWTAKQDKLTDNSGNMTLAGGLTAAGTINANGGVNIPVAPSMDTQAARKHEVRVLNEIANGACRSFFNFSTIPFGRLLSPFSWLATYWPKPATDNGWVDFNFRCDVFGEEFDSGGSYTGVTGVFFPLSSCLGYQRMFQIVAGGIADITLNEEWSGPDDHPFSDPPNGVSMWWDVYFGDRIAEGQDLKIPARGRFCRYNHSTKQVELLTKTMLLPLNLRLRGIAIGWGDDGVGGMWIVGSNEKTAGRLEAYRICDNTWLTSSYAGCVNNQIIRLLSNRNALRVGVDTLRLYTGIYGQKSVVAEWCEMMEVKQ